MADLLTPAISDRICKHMNDDHAEAVVLYAKCFGNVDSATAAQMQSIDSTGMDIQVESGGETSVVRVEFDHALTDSEDAHQTLIAMVRKARSGAK
ncbi:MAG: DUF2470 domain-containing protein [Cyanobacteria bacterium P01_F01_bin.42]